MLEHPKDLGTICLIPMVTILNMIQWAISRKPNHVTSMRVGSSETTREAQKEEVDPFTPLR